MVTQRLFLGLLGSTLLSANVLACPAVASVSDAKAQVESYATLVSKNYQDAYDDALALQRSVDALLANPNQQTLEQAKHAWLKSRNSYGQTEAFRFYEGPIDFVDSKQGKEGPEGRLNAWPLNEAYIDYVEGNDKAGIINSPSIPITKESLIKKNQADDEADVATGYHAIEFLLWGQDLSNASAGKRPFADFEKGKANNDRRRSYLQTVTSLLVDDLRFLVESWQPNKDNYAKQFIHANPDESLSHILSALATLSGFELSSERMATSLDSGDQEDEHSCFSDNTHNDFIYNAKGIRNVYLGEYGSFKGSSIHDLLKGKDAKLAEQLAAQLKHTETAIAAIPYPIDREVLAKAKGDANRKKMEEAVASLQKQAELFKQAGKVLGVKVEIVQ